MGKIVITKNWGMMQWSGLALVTLCVVLTSVFIPESALALNPIMHNSSTGRSVNYGSWGQGKDCTWCHSSASTANIKKIANTIDTPSGPRSVIFYRMTANRLFDNRTGVLGNDNRTYKINASTNVCEVCHLKTAFHKYSSEDGRTSGDHYNNQNCAACHLHADGFKPNRHTVPYYAAAGGGHGSCSSAIGCHTNGNPSAPYPTASATIPPDCRACHAKADPTDALNGCGSCHGVQGGTGQPVGTASPDAAGSHAAHTSVLYEGKTVTCTDCHTSGGFGSTVDHGKGNRGLNPAQVNLDATFGWNDAASTCASASCHMNPYAATAIVTPAWGTPVGCAACHNQASSIPFGTNGAPATGSHDTHMALAGSGCQQCHDGAAKDSSGGLHHLDGNVDVTNGYPVDSPKRTPGTGYGACSNATCHADPYSAGLIASPTWGSAVGCAACHNYFSAVFGGPTTGSHTAHMKVTGTVCSNCHEGAVNANDINRNGGFTHADGRVDVANGYVGSPVAKHAPVSYAGYCLSASCHASPYGAGAVNSPAWGTKSGCASCHNAAGAFTATGAPATGSHDKHLALPNVGCGRCHSGAVSGVNPGNHHSNGFVNVTSGYTASPVMRHPIGTYGGTCANECHTDGNGVSVPSAKWGVAMSANCTGCHGGAANVTPASKILATGKHRSHMNNYSTLGLGNNFKCAECHAKTVALASDTALSGPGHVNHFKDYSGVKAGGSSNYSTASGVCSNVYCHSNGQSVPRYKNMTGSKSWNAAAKFNCSGCHGSESGATWSTDYGAPNYPNKYDGTLKTANSHERHNLLAGATDSRSCAKCHDTSVDASVGGKLRNYSTTHLNKVVNISFGIYGRYSTSNKSCSTYCHSNVQAPGGNAPATTYATPVWGDNGSMNCASCHKNMASLAETAEDLQLGSHRRHVATFTNPTSGSSGAGYDCSVCHGASYTKTSADTVTHANGAINTDFTGHAAGTTYSQAAANAPGDTYGTCSTSKCHGRATRNWGISTTDRLCEKCHGSSRSAIENNTFKDTAGSPASPYTGTHLSHLAATHKLTSPMQCEQCHVVPAFVNSSGHMNGMPASITWGPLSARKAIIRGYTASTLVMSPTYNPGSRQCNNTYCHAGVQIKNQTTGIITPQGSKPNPTWADAGYLAGTGCNMCHGYPPGGQHPTSTICSGCHAHVDQSNLAFVQIDVSGKGNDVSKHMNGQINETADECLACHSSYGCTPEKLAAGTCYSKELVGGHDTHTNSEMFLKNADGSNKKLSEGDYIDTTWIYGISYKKGFPQYACGFCHPMNVALHKNGVVEVDLDPTHAFRGSVKTKNKPAGTVPNGWYNTWIKTYVPGTVSSEGLYVSGSVVCSNVYCHSSGYVSPITQQYQFQETPDWYYADSHGGSSAWAGQDRCNKCHGNSPNTGLIEGSSAHARHVVANHFKDVFDGYSAKLKPAGAAGTGAVHGDPATATNFNCNICHFSTVRTASNDKGSVCIDCHNGVTAQPKGMMVVYSSSTKHVNGDVDVVFMTPFNVKSKAQVRDNIASVQSIYTSWTRVNGYKNSNSYDQARTTPVYASGTCSTTACHNNTLMEWRTKGPLRCSACHNGLPQ